MSQPVARLALSLSLSLAAASALAQQQPAAPGGAHATQVREATTIRRNTDQIANVGDFARDTPVARPVRPPPDGDVGSTGAVAERRPDSQLRGSVGPAPGEIDMTRPIGAADVARIVRAYEPRLRPCYDRARATQPTLAGRVNIRFVVARDGSLTNIDVSGLPAAPAVSTCIRDQLAQTSFPRPESGTLPFATGMNFAPPANAAPPRGRRGASRSRSTR